jgi:FtsH-binding integral membrane protein
MNTYYNQNYGGVNNGNPEWKPAAFGENDMEMGVGKLDTDLTIRLGFIRKVYGILSIQLLITTLMCLLSISSPSYAKFQLENYGICVFCSIGTIITMISIVCCSSVARKVPTNYIVLMAFTCFEGYLVSFLCAKTNPRLVLMAVALTCAVTTALTVYACSTKTDFTVLNSVLFIAVIVLLLFSLLVAFTHNKTLHVIYCCCGVFVYAIYLIYDTQLIIGNKEYSIEVDDYIYGALMLYIDIIYLFINLLQILKSTDS